MTTLRTCPSCGAAWEQSAKFCPEDGAPLASIKLDRYLLLRRVAHGGMSEVFEAHHEHIDRRVALKLMRSSLARDGEELERLRREARAASAIGHPNIVEVTDFGQTEDGSVYMVMEWLDGETLRELLETGPVDPKLALDIAHQAAAGLAAAHAIGVIHRDVKPENVGLVRRADGSYLVKIVDFGIAKMLAPGQSKLTRTGTFIGTPAYVSPEQARGEKVDGRTDVYSLGCVLYELFTGSAPFGQASAMELVHLHTTVEPQPPSQRAPARHIPDDVERLILCCLEKQRDKRFSSMAKLRDAIDGVRHGKATFIGVRAGGRARVASSAPPPDDGDAAATLRYQKGEPRQPLARAQAISEPPPIAPTPGDSPGPDAPPRPADDDTAAPTAPRSRRWVIAGVAITAFAVVGATLGIVVSSRDRDTAASAASDRASRDEATAHDPEVTAERETDPAPERDAKLGGGSDVGADAAPREQPTGRSTDIVEAPQSATGAGSTAWQFDKNERRFAVRLTASPRPLMPRAPIELDFELSELQPPISWAVTEGKLRADVQFVHYVQHETLGLVTGRVDDTGHFHVIFSVPQAGKYHLRLELSSGARTVGTTQIDICVGADPDGPNAESLCPQLNQLKQHHEPAVRQ